MKPTIEELLLLILSTCLLIDSQGKWKATFLALHRRGRLPFQSTGPTTPRRWETALPMPTSTPSSAPTPAAQEPHG